MAEISITQYARVGRNDGGSPLPAGEEPSLGHEIVAVGVSSLQSAVFDAATRFIRVVADVDCRIVIGATPTATATSMILPAGDVEYFGINDKVSARLAVIQL